MISKFSRVLNVVCFLLGNSPDFWILYSDVSKHSVCSIFIGVLHTYRPTKMEQTECSETSAYKIQTLENYPEESTQHVFNSSGRSESLIPWSLLYKILQVLFNTCYITCGLSCSRLSGTEHLLVAQRCCFQNRKFMQQTVFSSVRKHYMQFPCYNPKQYSVL